MNNRIKVAKKFANSINSDKIIRIILFGSVARGDDDKDSDIDILIVSDYWEDIDPKITELVGQIMYEDDELISAHVMNIERFNTTQHYSFLSNVLKDVLYLSEVEEFFNKANNKLIASKGLYNMGQYSTAVSTCYYAMFLTAKAFTDKERSGYWKNT